MVTLLTLALCHPAESLLDWGLAITARVDETGLAGLSVRQ